MRALVEATIEVIRPALQADGGDIVLRDVDPTTGVVSVTLLGACGNCPASTQTLKAGIERIMKDRVAGVTEVVNVDGTTPIAPGTGRSRHGSDGRSRPPRLKPPSVLPCPSGPSGPDRFDLSMSRRHRPTAELFADARTGDRAAIARLLSLIERGGDEAREIGRLASPLGGTAYTVGLTGAPGAGKSTLTSATIGHLREQDIEVAVLAIDPSSPFTGGAILGDRVRMQDHATDPGVFIRSMATRGHLGGLSLATPEAVRLLDAIGRRWILVETVGVGQVEVEIAGKADTTVVVVNPGWGDSVQANKAGLMEIADVFVINKADRKGVDETRRDLEQMLDLSDLPHDAWRPPIVPAVGHRGRGRRRAVGRGARASRAHHEPRASSTAVVRSGSARSCARSSPVASSRRPARSRPASGGTTCSSEVLERQLDPWSAADEMLAGIGA